MFRENNQTDEMKDSSEEGPMSVRLSKQEASGAERIFELYLSERTVRLRQGYQDKMKKKVVTLRTRVAALAYYEKILKRKTETGFRILHQLKNERAPSTPGQDPSAQRPSSAVPSPSVRMSESPAEPRQMTPCSQGRDTDNEYEMDYERMTQLLLRGLKTELPSSIRWKPLKLWKKMDGSEDTNAKYYQIDLKQKLAGSCHQLLLCLIKGGCGRVVRRIVKLARDPDEDNYYHFEVERQVAYYLSRIAKTINQTVVARTDVSIWPVEIIQFDYVADDHVQVDKWAVAQAPFLPEEKWVFVKVEPNSGKPCIRDPSVGRYQHAFAAVTKGVDLLRDWQGFGVPQDKFLAVCKQYDAPEGAEQIRIRENSHIAFTLVVIDPVLITIESHFRKNNPTDFGFKAMDEWTEDHDCVLCKCDNWHLVSPLIFGIADPGQRFFTETVPPNMMEAVRRCRELLDIFTEGDQTSNSLERCSVDLGPKPEHYQRPYLT